MCCVLLLALFAGFAIGWFSGLICLRGFCGGFPIVGLRVLRVVVYCGLVGCVLGCLWFVVCCGYVAGSFGLYWMCTGFWWFSLIVVVRLCAVVGV